MNETIEKFGSWLGPIAGKHPGITEKILAGVYKSVSLQASRFPNTSAYMPSREYMQGITTGLMSQVLTHPGRCAVVNIFMSCEIFHVLNIRVSAPEALSILLTNTAVEQPFIQAAQDNGASENFCSFHRALLGLAETGVLRAPMFIAHTTTACDANQLTFHRLSEIWKVPRFVIDVPYDVSEDAVCYVAGQLKELQKAAEECARKKTDPALLRQAVARSIRTQEAYRRYLAKRSRYHLPEVMTPELLNVFCSHLYLGNEEAERYAQMLEEELSTARPAGSAPKILWMHVVPNAQEPLKAVFQGKESSHFEVLGCDLAYDNLVPMDENRPYESMARRMVYSSYNGPGSRRIQRTLELARQMKADGVLIFCQWGCKQTQGIAYAAKKTFEEAGFPTLVLDGDACDRTNEASGQALTRVAAFEEELRGNAGV